MGYTAILDTLPLIVIPLYAFPHLCQQGKKLGSSLLVRLFDADECLTLPEAKERHHGLLRGSERMIDQLAVSLPNPSFNNATSRRGWFDGYRKEWTGVWCCARMGYDK